MGHEPRDPLLDDPTLPVAIRQALESGSPLEEIRLDRFGRWWHLDQQVTHPRIADLFHRSIQRTPGGSFFLAIGPFVYPIRVEDTPYFVVGLSIDEPTGEAVLRLSDQTEEPLDVEGLCFDLANRLVVRVKRGLFEARFLRAPYHELLGRIVDTPSGYALRLGPRIWPLKIAGI